MVHLLLIIIYAAFISLGLPDALLGAAWPTIYEEFQVPVSYAGIISMIIALGTVISSLQSDRMTLKFGTGKVTAFSVAMTAIALFGFSASHSFIGLCLWAIPYGLGAGSVDASLNNYVALHYESRHMSWLHCMWGIGATVGPYIIGAMLTKGNGWNIGYFAIGILQVVLTAVLICSLPLWKKRKDVAAKQSEDKNEIPERKPLTLRQILRIPGAKAVMAAFFCYCAIEQTAGLWAASYLTLYKGIAPETAASFASLFFIGITVGRAVSGFVTMRFSDTQMVYIGEVGIAIGIAIMLLPGAKWFALAGLILIGLGCAPIYPCTIHATPERFGEANSQAVIGVQMASAYVGILLMPTVFGLIANHISIALFPMYLLVILVVMSVMFFSLAKTKGKP